MCSPSTLTQPEYVLTSSPGIATSDNAHAQLLYTQDLDDALHVKEVDKGSVLH